MKLWGYRVNNGCETVPSQHEHCSQGSSLVQSFTDTPCTDGCLSIGEENKPCPSYFFSHSLLEQEGFLHQAPETTCKEEEIKIPKQSVIFYWDLKVTHSPHPNVLFSFMRVYLFWRPNPPPLLLFIWAHFYLWINCKCVYSKITTLSGELILIQCSSAGPKNTPTHPGSKCKMKSI